MAHPSTSTAAEDPGPVNASDVQAQAAETTNESPTAAIPIPYHSEDLERGDDMAATLVNDPPQSSASSSSSNHRPGWTGLANLSLSAFTGQRHWREAREERDRNR